MECKNALENLVAFLDGELDKDLIAQINRHLESCNACRNEAESLSKTWNLLDKFPELEPTEKSAGEIKDKIRLIAKERSGLFPIHRWQRIAVFSAAASLFIVVGFYCVINNFGNSPYSPQLLTVSYKAQEEIKTKLNYYTEILARFKEVKDEDYWSENDSKSLSPYLYADAWNF